MVLDLWSLYAKMLESRLFEEAVARLWQDGLISGEMHLGTGEEAIIAGVVSHLQEGDAMALDHRGTAALLMRGEDPVPLLREMLGRPDGLCSGMGGHMHLFSKKVLAVSSGIVGASGPTAAGFALSTQYLHPGSIAVAFFGEGAINEGMLMESMNLAAFWRLPILFVCKDDGWAITTRSAHVSGGDLKARAVGFGLPVLEVDGCEVGQVWVAAHEAVERARSDEGPTFLHARCVHLEGHFLGFQLTRVVRNPLGEMPKIAVELTASLLHRGGGRMSERLAGLKEVIAVVLSTLRDPRRDPAYDPVRRVRNSLLSDVVRLQELENQIEQEMSTVIASSLAEVQA